jgi:AcrR family transcriptional regulator
MPKISEERRTERREQILEGARRCFAEHGYEGATVARLEREIGLSRGAIFNYFASKGDLFLELARRDNERLVRLWVDKGWEATLREVVEEDPEWIGVYLEMNRRERTDPELGRRYREYVDEELAPLIVEHVQAEQARGKLRSDVPAEKVAGFVSLVANGIAVQKGSGEPIRDFDTLVELVRAAVGAPRASRTRARRKRPAPSVRSGKR